MQWNMNLNAGFSQLTRKTFSAGDYGSFVSYESVNVAAQEENPSSMMWWIKNVLAMRKRLNVFGRGDLRFIESSNAKVLCFARSYKNQKVVVVANLSQFSQATTWIFQLLKIVMLRKPSAKTVFVA